jgi:tetraacyldisaccharide-1-P 4'-kinase
LAEIVDTAAAIPAVPVTTAKDAVKLPPDSRVWVVEVAVEPVEGNWNGLWRLLPEVRS